MTNDERLARLEERVNNLCDDLKELKDGQNRILGMLQNGYFEQKVKNVIKQQIGGWILGIFFFWLVYCFPYNVFAKEGVGMKLKDYANIVQKYCGGIKPELVMGIIEKESGFNVYAIGKADDKGLMQLTPIALEHLRQLGYEIGDVMDAEENIRLGCAYLQYIYDTLKNKGIETNIDFWALCAYNGGITYVLDCISKGIKPDNWHYAIDVIAYSKRYKGLFGEVKE